MAKKKVKRSIVRRWVIILLVLIAAAVIIGAVGYNMLRGSVTDKDSVLYVYENTTFDVLMDSLTSGEKVNKPERFRQVAHVMKLDESIRAGRYEIKKDMSARQLAGMIRSGNQSPVNVTFNNIRTLPQFAGTLGGQLMADSVRFAEILLSDSTASSYGFKKEEFIGMFIPNTYQVYWTTSPEAFVQRMNGEYEKFWDETRRSKLKRTGLTSKQVAVMASIIDEETNKTDEMPTMAGVYINRIRKGMLLQADPTVKFAVGDFTIKRVLNKHLTVDSPYNTYKYAGLPPGPIRMPSIAAVDAVLNFKEHDYLYFCAKADFSGYHSFAKTLAEHQRNARAYTAALDKLGIK